MANDYRYFPEPDLPPVVLSEEYLTKIKTAMPALPAETEALFQSVYGLSAYDAEQLSQERNIAFYARQLLETATLQYSGKDLSKTIANLLINKLLPWSAAENKPLNACPVRPENWIEYAQLIESGQLSASTAAQRLFPALLEHPDKYPTLLATELNLLQSADSDFLEQLVEEVLARFPDKVAEYRKGKKGLLAMFMGEVMKASKGKAEPQSTTRILQDKLK